MTANIRFEDWEAERMQDPEFRAVAEELEPAYQMTCLRIKQDLIYKRLAELISKVLVEGFKQLDQEEKEELETLIEQICQEDQVG